MDFAEKYSKSVREISGFFDSEVENRIVFTNRIFACFVCGKRTGFHFLTSDCPSVPCCGEECLATALEWESTEDPDFKLSPSSSVEERLHDSQEVVGSNPASGITLWEQTLLHMLEIANG